MSGTMAETDIGDLSAFEFEIGCEWEGCIAAAVIMGKACVDSRHVAVCAEHHLHVRNGFDNIPAYFSCAACGKPLEVFEDHFDIRVI